MLEDESNCLLFSKVENPLYILLVLVGTGDTLIVSGIAGFAPKIIEEKFSVKPTQSGLIMGKQEVSLADESLSSCNVR